MLFDPLTLRSLTIPNRVWLSPMCQYSVEAQDGVPTDWHLMHLGQYAAGGFGLLVTEASAVCPEGRITPQDTGIWTEDQVTAWRRITDFAHDCDALIAIQLQHAGRKASTYRPWAAGTGTMPASDGGWRTVAPSALAFPGLEVPDELTVEGIAAVVESFALGARNAVAAGFDAVEVHAAHGYLLHQFLSPLSNERTDDYGGSLENRARLLAEVVGAVRAEIGDRPLIVRVSATDWLAGGLTPTEVGSVLAGIDGIDFVDVSTGAVLPAAIPAGPGYQVPAAREVARTSGLPVSAVGLITDPHQAETLLVDGDISAVFLGRTALREPHWPLSAAAELGVPADQVNWRPQYVRGALR